MRDREAEFDGRDLTPEQGQELLDGADELITELEPRISPERLNAPIALPTLPADAERVGLTWLIANYGHAREHLGHVQLTKQLYRAESSAGLNG